MYSEKKYNHKVRWMNYWHQIDEIYRLTPESILEVGKGNGLVSDHLRKMGYKVTTLDTDPEVKPDIVASVEAMPVSSQSYDLILAAEVLEHLPFDKLPAVVKELKRVARRFVIITLPYAGGRFDFFIKIPKIPKFSIFTPLPYFWVKHKLSKSGHYWEIGKRGYSRNRIRNMLKTEFGLMAEQIFPDDFNHIFYILDKRNYGHTGEIFCCLRVFVRRWLNKAISYVNSC